MVQTHLIAQKKELPRWGYQPYYGTNRTVPTNPAGIVTEKGQEIGCSHDELHDRRMATDPDYRSRYVAAQETVYQIVKQELEDQRNGKSLKNKNGKGTILERMSSPCLTGGNSNVLTIPVVVHVMHLSGTPIGTNENISDAQIQAGIQHLNDAYRNIGAYAGGPYFTNAGIASADVEIQFCLASRDPNGNATTGINRIATSMSNLFSDDIVSGTTTQDDALKALSFWNSNNYMNVWIVNEICTASPSTGCGVAGYAYLASAHGAAYDGIVNEARYWGSTTNNSKVHIHEVGHYLNLSHTFNDPDGTGALTACDNTNCLTQGDFVSDTPPDGDTNAYNCSSSQTANSCSTDANDTSPNNPFTTNVQDIYEDYMDYGYQSCQNTFTPAQKTRMRAALLGIRASLLTSEGCIPVTTREAGITNILNPNGAECASPLAPIVAVKNYGTAAITSLIISYQTDGGTINNYNWAGSLAAGSTINITLPNITFATGNHTFYAYISDVNGAGADTHANNDNYCVTFINDPVTSFPYCENFESGNLNNWSIQNPDNGFTWTTKTGLACGHGTAAHLNFYNYATVGQQDRLVSKVLDLSTASSAQLVFDVAYAAYASNYSDGLQVQISTNCGETFTTTLYDKAGSVLSTAGSYQTSEWFPTSCGSPNHWRTETIDLSAYVGSSITVSFTSVNAYGNNLFLDNICFNATTCTPITATATPTQPTCGLNNGSISVTPTGATYAWTGGLSGSNPTGVAPGTYTVTVTSGGCSSTASATLSNIAITPTASNTSPACAGGSVVLSVSPNPPIGVSATAYSWSGPAGTASVQNPTINNLTTAKAGVYTVTVTYSNGCTATATTAVIVNSKPIISSVAASCVSGSGRITVNATGTTLTYSIGGAPQSSNVFNGVGNGTYTVVVTGSNGCTATATVIVNCAICPTATASSNSPVCTGATISLTVNPNLPIGVTATYFWSGPSGTATVQNPFITNATPTKAGVYTVTVTYSNGCIATASTTVALSPTLSGTILGASSFCVGGSTVLTATGGGTYAWSTGATTAAITITAAGTYVVTITNGTGCKRVSKTVTTTTCKNTGNNALTETLWVSPNPFADRATIEFMTNSTGHTTIKAYSVEGKEVATLYNAGVQAGEIYQVTLDRGNLPSGLYFVEMINANGKKTLIKVLISR